jgi:hypothetical protein
MGATPPVLLLLPFTAAAAEAGTPQLHRAAVWVIMLAKGEAEAAAAFMSAAGRGAASGRVGRGISWWWVLLV